MFCLTGVGVIWHFLPGYPNWLLLLTAAVPALGAAIHGILSKLEFARLAQQSALTADMLDSLCEALNKLEHQCSREEIDPWQAWVRLRALTEKSDDVMSD